MENNVIEKQETIKEVEKDKEKAEHSVAMIIITLATLLLAIFGKLLTMGWMTIIMIMFMILPAHFILFTVTGIKMAFLKNKTQKDYKFFTALCITLLLYTFTFVDVGDTPTGRPDYIIEILSIISATAFGANIVLSFIILQRRRNKDL